MDLVGRMRELRCIVRNKMRKLLQICLLNSCVHIVVMHSVHEGVNGIDVMARLIGL
jgi:hypothetical protein